MPTELLNPFSIAGRRAIVTGGTRGIGRAIALHFARAGADVLAVYVRDTDAAATLEEQARTESLQLRTCRADLTSEAGQTKLLESLAQTPGDLSFLIHAAATGVHRPFDQLTARHFDWTFSLNVRSFLQLVIRLSPLFAGAGSIVALSSAGATRAVPQYTLVGASKGALESMVRHLAVELAPRGIRVNSLAPGTVLTDAWNALPDRENRLAEAAKRSPIGRLTTVEDVANAAHFLCSNAASGIVGHTLVVDGGCQVLE
jgi:enoyl-[acyl-carrier protein] reductase III